MPDLQKKLEEILNKRNTFIDSKLEGIYDEMGAVQKELTAIILSKYVNKFEIVEGQLVFNKKNLALISEMDSIFTTFENKFSANVFKEVGANMLDMVVYSEEYFKQFGSTSKTLAKIQGKLDIISKRVGIDASGNLIKNSYLERLANGGVIKEQLKDYVAKGLASKTSLAEFQSGFETIINGAEGLDSDLLRYWKTETHDAFFSVARSQDDLFAQQLGLNFFMYLPGSIKRSRPFCKGGFDKKCGCTFESKIGKIFHRMDAEKWKVLNWQGKKTPYNPIVDLGGWNCRHQPHWISNEMAEGRAPEKYEEYKDIIE